LTGGNSEKLGDRNSNNRETRFGALKASDPVPNHTVDRIMNQKLKFLEVLDKKIGSANILAISMLSEIRKRSLKERDLFIYDTKVPWSKRRDLKEMLPSPSGQEVVKECQTSTPNSKNPPKPSNARTANNRKRKKRKDE